MAWRDWSANSTSATPRLSISPWQNRRKHLVPFHARKSRGHSQPMRPTGKASDQAFTVVLLPGERHYGKSSGAYRPSGKTQGAGRELRTDGEIGRASCRERV